MREDTNMSNFYYETKKMSNQAKERSYSEELESVKFKITLSAMQGNNTCVITGNISYEVENYLKEQGFSIEYYQEYGQRFGYKISW